ncbi:NADPH-dependent diflavin oxidoreductase 1 [Halotydeus destructor]|nr:NADPH-dependent diflavin oxidoreductase 1 [Halotydeus destructor]
MALFSSLVLFYAGETGNCEDLSKRIYNYGRQRRVKVTVNAIDDFGSVSVTDDDLVLFICSTTGHGDVPLNMKQFWRLVMRKNVDTDLFGKLNCCVIGLGDSSYVKYNVVAKKLFKRLDQLGANLVSPLTLGDDQHDLGSMLRLIRF